MNKRLSYILILGSILIILGGCTDEMEFTPRAANFTSFYPVNETSGIEPFITFYWTCDFGYYYDLYFGTIADSLIPVVTHEEPTEYTITELHLGITYYWQVVAYNGADEQFYGPVLSFSTREGNWGTFFPEDNSTDIPLELVFSWGMSREQAGELSNNDLSADSDSHKERVSTDLYYDFYLGCCPDSLSRLAENLTDLSYPVSDLLWNSEYYWQVKVRNDVTELSPSPLLSFVTRLAEWQDIAPADSSQQQPVNIDLSWTVSEPFSLANKNQPDNARVLSQTRDNYYFYDLYWGTSATDLSLLAEGLSENTYHLEELAYRNEYFWQVKALYLNVQELESAVYSFVTIDRFSDMHPGGYELYVDTNPLLSWSCLEGVSYELYFGEAGSELDLIAQNLSDTTYTLHNLAYDTVYDWQVEALLTDGSFWLSPVTSFITIVDPVPPGYNLHEHLIRAEQPCNIDVVYRVTDRADQVTTELEQADFRFLEDADEIDPVESQLQIVQGDEINSSMRTVLMIDNSTSMDNLLEDIKLAAYEFVERLDAGQQMCVYTFSEQPVLAVDFTSSQGQLIAAINSITSGYSSTDLYGAIIEGVSRWEDIYLPENLIKGNLIMITDGSDTQGSSTLAEALQARCNKQVFTLGIGADIDTQALSALGNGGFFELAVSAQAASVFQIIQAELSSYLNSFYWLHYITPKRGDVEHTISISIIGNPNTGSSGIIEGTFNSAGFYGTLPGVYVNIDPDNGLPYGIEEFTISDSASHLLTATTYNFNAEPQYEWDIDDEDIAVILWESSHSIVIRRGIETGITELTVTDFVNDHVRVIDLIVE